MPAPFAPYDPRQTPIVFNGRVLTGYAPDTFASFEPAADSVTKQVGADGTVVFTHSADKTGALTVTLLQTSPDHAYLAAAEQGKIIAPVAVRDENLGEGGTTLLRCQHATVSRRPAITRGAEATTHEWTFVLGQTDIFVPGAV